MRTSRLLTFSIAFIVLAAIIGFTIYKVTKPFQDLTHEQPVKKLDVYSTVPEFTLTRQDGTSITRDDLKGQIWLANMIFTRCEGICPVMSGNFSKLQGELDSSVKLVSFSVDPAYDDPAVLTAYGQRHNADARWTFVTGDRADIFRVAKEGFLLGADSTGRSPGELVTHSEKFVLIDKHGNMRGYYDGTKDASRAQVLADIKLLSAEGL